jgi:hypothetical protein
MRLKCRSASLSHYDFPIKAKAGERTTAEPFLPRSTKRELRGVSNSGDKK